MADKNRTQQKAPHGRAKACMTGKRALAFTLSVLLAWMLAMPSVTSATTDDGTGVEEVAAATAQEESPASSKAAGTDSSAAATTDTSAKDSSAAASDSASETSADSKAGSSDTAQSSATTSENVSGGGTSEAESDDASASEESSSVAEESAAAKAAPALEDANSSTQISSASDLGNIANGGSYQLANDITYGNSNASDDAIHIKSGKTVTLDLNGHTINYVGKWSLFHVENGGSLTITDSQAAADNVVSTSTVDAKNNASSIGKTASVEWDGDAPTKLTYYVTKSNVGTDGISTTESCEQHEVTPGGVINATYSKGANSVIYMDGGTLNIQGGMITMANAGSYTGSAGHIIDVNGGTFNMSGGYVCGGTFQTGRNSNDHGGGVLVRGGSMMLSGGVIAANSDGEGGGIYNSATLSISGGVVSGNWVPVSSYGGGISSVNGTLTVSGGYITNNVMSRYCGNNGWGDHGGGGIAARGTGSLGITGGYITGNKSQEAGGGIYAGANNVGLKSFTITGGTIASNASENSEGGGVRVSQYTKAVFDAASGKKIYITNNACNSTFDWGGGGVFVQAANSVQNNGDLVAKNALITNNTAGGYGGGLAACPTGETVVTHTQGAAIYGNHDACQSTPNFYQGTVKNMDSTVAYPNSTFRYNGHADYFLVRGSDNSSYISVITGRMLGDGAAKWSGSIDGVKTDIDPNSGAEAKYMVGLTANPDQAAKTAAIGAATLIISGNYSHNHGGGIMTNGGVTLGDVKNIDIYPGLSFNAKKSLTQDGASAQLTDDEYTFVLLSPASSTSAAPSWNSDGTLNYGGCTESERTKNDANGNIHFNVSSEYSQAGEYRYYVAEIPNSGDTTTKTYDKTIYRIDADIREDTSQRTTLLGITFKHYTISNLRVTPITNGVDGTPYKPSTTTADSITSFTLTKDGNSSNAAFTNTLKPYSTTGSFAPKVTKTVTGGEMKTFTFKLYSKDGLKSDGTWDDSKVLDTKTNDADGNVNFDSITYTLGLKDLDTKARGGKTTYDYYIREQSGAESGYTYDSGYIKVHVTVIDNSNGSLTVDPAYTYCEADGTATKKGAEFDNKYAQSLPNAGQAGIALVYVAGGAALAYGLWRLAKSRRDARKGGDGR